MLRIKNLIISVIRFVLLFFIHLYCHVKYYVTNLRNRNPIHISNNAIKSKKFLIYSIYFEGEIPSYIIKTLKFFIQKKYSIFLINNAKIKNKDTFKTLQVTYIERENTGRDFGGYQYGYKYISNLITNKNDLDEVIFLNSSVAIINKRLESFYKKMIKQENHDVIYVTDTYEKKWHGASWFFRLNRKSFFCTDIEYFFYNLKTLNSRPYIIDHGEILLSQTLLKNNFSINVLFGQNETLSLLANKNLLFSIRNYLPMSENNFLGEKNKKELDPDIFLREMKLSIHNKNSTHIFSLIFLKFFDSYPFIKKDIINRGVILHNQFDFDYLYKLINDEKDYKIIHNELLNKTRKVKTIFDKLSHFLGLK